jgi:uncharacterized protein (DUF1501 family)
MFRLLRESQSLCDGYSRREWIRVGGIGLGGLTLPGLLQHRQSHAADNPPTRAKSVIVLFNSGGMPQHETFDPKPEAPAEIRGAFGAIATHTPGLQVGELMPKIAQLTDRMAVIRSMVTGDNAHSTSGYQMLTGVPHAPLGRENAAPGKPNDWPSMGGLVSALRPPRAGLPSSIALPRRMANNNGQDPWPGTDAGFLGRRYDPWLLECDPSAPDFMVPGGRLADGLTPLHVDNRRSLLKQFNEQADQLQRHARVNEFNRYRQQAIDLVVGGAARQAFDLSQESDRVRDSYGRHQYGQSVLLARRLVEAGVSLVQVQWASLDKDKPNGGGWDTHEKHNESIKGWLIPVMDQVYSTLLLDLEERGLLSETLVCLVTEFGHTPNFNAQAGRDHWGRVFSIALAGGGIRGGVVYGSSDKHAAEPHDNPVPPCDYLATVFHLMGYSADTIVHDIENRPLPISRGKVIEAIVA